MYQMQPQPGQAQPSIAPQYSTQPTTQQTTPGSYPDPAGQQPVNTQPIGMYSGGGVPGMYRMQDNQMPSMFGQLGQGQMQPRPQMGGNPGVIPPQISQMNQKIQNMGHPGGGFDPALGRTRMAGMSDRGNVSATWQGKGPPSQAWLNNPARPRTFKADGDHVMMEKPKKGGFVLAHFSKLELPVMDDIQHKRTNLPGTTLRIFKDLEKGISSDPEFKSHVDHKVREYAEGGQIHAMRDAAARMKHMGRGGDTEMALIGPHTKALFDHLAGGGSINPHTGHPEYFSLGGFLGGLGKVAKKALPMAAGAMNMMPGGGGKFGQMANMANSMFGGGQGAQAPGWMQKAQGFLNNNPYGQAMKMAGSHFMNTNPQAQQMKQRAQDMFSQGNGRASQFMNSPFGQNVMNAGRTAMDAYRGGEDFGRSAARGVSNFAQNYDNPYSHMARGMADQYSMPDEMGGGSRNMGRAAARGMDYASRQSSNPYAQMGGMMANAYANGPDQGYGGGQQGGGYNQGGYGNPAGMDQDMWDQL